MNQSVIIKGNKTGITVILDQDLAFETLLTEIKEKFKESAEFFKNAKMAICFEGRKLTTEEEYRILKVIEENTTLNIVCVIDKDEERERRFENAVNQKTNGVEEDTGLFYKGTLRSGQLVESAGSIIILGDVNPGGKVIAKGNIIVLGALRGTAYAGITGNMSKFVVALEMSPIQIRIGDVIARSSDRKNQITDEGPMIAIAENDNIYIEPINRTVLDDINFI